MNLMNLQKREDFIPFTEELVEKFLQYLTETGKKENTLYGYENETRSLIVFLKNNDCKIGNDTGNQYMQWLLNDCQYTQQTVNNKVAVFNQFMLFLGHPEWKVTNYYVRQDYQFLTPSREEYIRLLKMARENDLYRAYLLVKVFGGYGIPYRELYKLDVQAVKNREVTIKDLNVQRKIVLPGYFVDELMTFVRKRGLRTGPVFGTKGEVYSSSMINRDFGRLSELTGINKQKITPDRLVRMYRQTLQQVSESAQAYIEYCYNDILRNEQDQIGWFCRTQREQIF